MRALEHFYEVSPKKATSPTGRSDPVTIAVPGDVKHVALRLHRSYYSLTKFRSVQRHVELRADVDSL